MRFAVLVCVSLATSAALTAAASTSVPAACAAAAAAPSGAPAYYAIELVPTRRVPGTGASTGVAQVTFARSPFGVAVSPDGTHVHNLDVRVERIRPRRGEAFVVWAASADLDQVKRLGVLGDDLRVQGEVAWNKFLVIVSLEDAGDPPGGRWQGPIVMRGMSRSGMMHTMAGHGPFEAEPCAKYGYK